MLAFLGLIFLIIIQYTAAKRFEKIAFDKGYDRKAHPFGMCFWLGVIGYIYVAAMPKLTANEIQAKRNIEEQKTHKVDSDEFNKDDKVYQEAVQKMQKGNEYNSVKSYKEAIELFNTIPTHKNTKELAVYCERKIQELEKQN